MTEAAGETGAALVVTVSTRAAAGVYSDTAGPILVQGLRGLGLRVDGPVVVPDGVLVAETLRKAISDSYAAVVTTGGTGLSPTDRTPEATREVLDREIPGLAEALRAYGAAHGVPTAALSRGVAGVAGSTVIVNLPGSPGACRDGLVVLSAILPHAVAQVRGKDHTGRNKDETAAEG